MHPYFVYELARQHIAERERDAEHLRHLREASRGRAVAGTRRRLALPHWRRYPRPVARGAC